MKIVIRSKNFDADKIRPYKVHLRQVLSENDLERLMQFGQEIMNSIEQFWRQVLTFIVNLIKFCMCIFKYEYCMYFKIFNFFLKTFS